MIAYVSLRFFTSLYVSLRLLGPVWYEPAGAGI